jgi:hypothetical protein
LVKKKEKKKHVKKNKTKKKKPATKKKSATVNIPRVLEFFNYYIAASCRININFFFSTEASGPVILTGFPTFYTFASWV